MKKGAAKRKRKERNETPGRPAVDDRKESLLSRAHKKMPPKSRRPERRLNLKDKNPLDRKDPNQWIKLPNSEGRNLLARKGPRLKEGTEQEKGGEGAEETAAAGARVETTEKRYKKIV
jgi:hypothetical protein